MNNESLNKYKNRLEKERVRLLDEIKKHERPADFGDDVDEFEEDTDKTEDFSNRLAMANDLKKRLDEIDVALSKIKNGAYGVCEKCGGEIGEQTLQVSPEARLCADCAK